MTIENNPPNITNDWPPSIATDHSITVVINNYYDKQIIKIHLGINLQTIYSLNIGWGNEFKSNVELTNPGINTRFYFINATNNIDFNYFYNINNIENYGTFMPVTPRYTTNFLRLTTINPLSLQNNNFLELEVNQQYNIINPVTVFINQSFDWDINNDIIDGSDIIVPLEKINDWRSQQPTVNYIYNFNFPQNIIVNPSPNIPIVIYIENNGNWRQTLLEDGRYHYAIRFAIFYYQNDDWRDNLNNLINRDVFNLMTYTTPGNIVSNSENIIINTLISTFSGAALSSISNRDNVNGIIQTMTTISDSSIYPSSINYFTANINVPQYIINIQTVLYDNIDNLSIPFTEYKLIGKIDNPITDIPANEIFIKLIPKINIQKSFVNFNFIIIKNDLYTVQDYNLVNHNNSNILRIITLETIINNYDLNASVYGYNILYIEPIIPDINPYQLSLTTCCPPKVHHGNGIRRSWTAGTFLIDGSHLNKSRLCASRINNTIFGPINGKTIFVKNNLNVYGRYAGFSGGSGAPIRNKF